MSNNFRRALLLSSSALVSLAVLAAGNESFAQESLPEVVVHAPSPIVRRPAPRPAPPRPAPVRRTAGAPAPAPTPPPPVAPVAIPPSGTLPIVTDQFATVTVVPQEELRRRASGTLGDVLFDKPGITGSSFAPGSSSRPIIRGLDVNRVGITENGVAGNGASDLGEDHAVPVEPIVQNQVEVIRGPATLRYGSQAIGGVVESSNNRIPEALPCRDNTATQAPMVTKGGAVPYTNANPSWGCVRAEVRGNASTVDNGRTGAVLLDTGQGNWAFHVDAHDRKSDDYSVPKYPYLNDPTRPFNGKQPNSFNQTDGFAVGGSYVFDGGYAGIAYTRFNSLYGIPGIDGEDHHTRIDSHQDKVLTKGEWRSPLPWIDTVRFWGGATNYHHNEIGLLDPADLSTDGVRQTFINHEQEGRAEMTLMPINLRFADLTTAIGVQGGHQFLNAPSPDNPGPGSGLFGPNSNHRIAGYIFNEAKFTETTKGQLSARIERVDLSGMSRIFSEDLGLIDTMAVKPGFTPKSAAIGLIQNLPWDLAASITAQHVERAPKPAELFSGGPHDATATFDKGNPNLKIETAESIEVGLRRANAPLRFELTAYYTKFKGFIFRNLTGNTCDGDTGTCGPAGGDLQEAIYSQRNARFRGGEFQAQYDWLPVWAGMFGIEVQADVVRATFSDGTNVPRIPPIRAGGGVFWRDDNWLARTNFIHAWSHTQIDPVAETPTPGYNLLRAELSYRWRNRSPKSTELSEWAVGIVGDNLLNDDIRNSVTYFPQKDEILMPGRTVKFFANVKY